jgi:hypothetical protein
LNHTGFGASEDEDLLARTLVALVLAIIPKYNRHPQLAPSSAAVPRG